MGTTPEEQAFIDAYLGVAKRSVIEAARLAGFEGSDRKLARIGNELLGQPHIRELISASETNNIVADRDEVLSFLTKVMRDQNEETRHRIKAAEQLGKANGAFEPVPGVRTHGAVIILPDDGRGPNRERSSER